MYHLCSKLVCPVELLVVVRISHNDWPSNWDLLVLDVLWLIYWVRVLIDHSSVALLGHLHFLREGLVVNDWLHWDLSLHLVFHLSESLNFSVVLVDFFIDHLLRIKYVFTGSVGN